MIILKQTIGIHSQDIKMEFDIEKYAILIISGKRQITEGIEQQSQRRIRMLGEKENYKYLGILGVDTIKQAKMMKKNYKRVS